MKFWLFLVLAGLAFLYRNSFTAPFFQDDWNLLALARNDNIFTPIQGFPYRPLSIQIFYKIGLWLFGQNPLGFHLFLFAVFAAGLYFIYRLGQRLFRDNTIAKLVTIIYALNISLFPLFYWVAISYFVFAAFFVFGSIYFFLTGIIPLALLFFALGLLSNELVIVLPALLLLINWFLRKISWRKLLPFVVVDTGYLLWRAVFVSLPEASDYKLDFSAKFLATVRWYLLRIFNLPEGVKIAGGMEIYILFAIVVVILAAATIFAIRKNNFPGRLLFFATMWFFVGALPFYFLPGHMSAYYLTIALFGPALFSAKLLSENKKLAIIFLIVYILLAFLGLNYLSQTHWIITKPGL